ncbi:uncharacterized protein LOC26526258 [Drosophila erecta]|uniref:uncharacterized protein LOC26526258 n=1 Tax=Drosophila erecta TaxID=7220 RepID=UPI0007328C5D|nr:uncharacterized protein LOC26526258 [Drosophila erecta]KQS39191.1 uncharacterized protein Dere_GG26434 [Drosophila erecta]
MTKYFKRDIDFDVNREAEVLDGRTYGFLKTKGWNTPMPTAQKRIHSSVLIEKLREVNDQPSTPHESSTDSVQSSGMSFEMKRKLFDEAEFTITRGRKLSDLMHAADTGLNFKPYETGKKTIEEIEAYCRTINIKLAK